MKISKYFLPFLFFYFVYPTSLYAQVSPAYKNLEKYWYYRYRLVNDFLKVGGECGESIPAQLRIRDYPDNRANKLQWGDGTQSLGHYIGVLATEYRLLQMYGMDLKRTMHELHFALIAFERLDLNAETYMRDIVGTYPCKWQARQSQDRNGFFIRDDVSQEFVITNINHFNRTGLSFNDKIIGSETRSDYFIRYNALFSNIWNKPAPVYPYEESQDQVAEMFLGLAMASRQVDNNANIYGNWLRCNAGNSLYKMIEWIPKPRFSNGLTAPLAQANGLEAALTTSLVYPSTVPAGPGLVTTHPWTILNPLTLDCIYGVAPDQYGHAVAYRTPSRTYPYILTYNWDNQCSNGGALFWVNAYPAAEAAGVCGNPCGNNNTVLKQKALPYYGMFQISQFANLNSGRDLSFVDDFTAIAKNWEIRYDLTPRPSIWPANLPWNTHSITVNTTWDRLRFHSVSRDLYSPHTPLIYRLDKYGGGCGVGWEPSTFSSRFKNLPRYTELLDEAPPCGPHNYCGDFGNAPQWSGPNRLLEPDKRKGRDRWIDVDNIPTYEEKCDAVNASYNGLDYMFLFSLYALCETTNYLNLGFNNPYYQENYSQHFPRFTLSNNPATLGSHTYPLQLNFLEYLSAKNNIGSDGEVTFRGAKVVDILPGFNTEPGATFEAYVKDYSCELGDGTDPYRFAVYTDNNGNDIHVVLTNVDGDGESEGKSLQQPYIDDAEDREAEAILTPEFMQTSYEYMLGGMNGTMNKLEPEAILKLRSQLEKDNGLVVDGIGCIVTPNPSDGNFLIRMGENDDYNITLFNASGSLVYQTKLMNAIQLSVNLPNPTPGIYSLKVQGQKNTFVRKITIL